MSYGLQLKFDGYPDIKLSVYYPSIPIGCYYYQSNSVGGSFAFSNRVTTPSSAIRFGAGCGLCRAQNSSITIPLYVTGMTVGTTTTTVSFGSSGSIIEPRTTLAITIMADYSNVLPTSNYGLMLNNSGVESVLNGDTPPMRVVARYSSSITIPSKTQSVSYSCPELAAVRSGRSDLAFYVGCTNKNYFFDAKLAPANGRTWDNGAVIRIVVYPVKPNSSRIRGIEFDGGEAVAGTFGIKVLVAGSANTSAPTGYGLAVYAKNGGLSLAANNVPVFCGAVGVMSALPSNPDGTVTSTLGAITPLPSRVQSMVPLFPVGLFRLDESQARIKWYNENNNPYDCDIHMCVYNNAFVHVAILRDSLGFGSGNVSNNYVLYGATSYDRSDIRFGVVFDGDYFL